MQIRLYNFKIEWSDLRFVKLSYINMPAWNKTSDGMNNADSVSDSRCRLSNSSDTAFSLVTAVNKAVLHF